MAIIKVSEDFNDIPDSYEELREKYVKLRTQVHEQKVWMKSYVDGCPVSSQDHEELLDKIELYERMLDEKDELISSLSVKVEAGEDLLREYIEKHGTDAVSIGEYEELKAERDKYLGYIRIYEENEKVYQNDELLYRGQFEELQKRNDSLRQIKKQLEEQLGSVKKPKDISADLDSLITFSNEEVLFSDVGGLDHVLDKIKDFQYGMMDPARFEAYARKPPKGLFLYGPPGTGKTMIAKAMASEMDSHFYEIPITAFIGKYVGEAEKNLQYLLDKCKEKYEETGKRVIIFFDEAEQVMVRRGITSGHQVNDRVTNVLLRNMDGMATSDGLIFVAASNRIELVDEAALRSGRFDYKVEVPMPDLPAVEDILRKQVIARERISTMDLRLFFDLDYAMLADAMHQEGLSGADIAGVLDIAGMDKIRDSFENDPGEKIFKTGFSQITQKDIEEALDKFINETRKPVSEEELQRYVL